MERLLTAVANNFSGEEILRQRIINKTPFFGNDNDYADSIAVRACEDLFKAIEGKPNTKGESFHLNILNYLSRIFWQGYRSNSLTAALLAFVTTTAPPLHRGQTPTAPAVIKSLGKLDQIKSGGTLLNSPVPSITGKEQLRPCETLPPLYEPMNGHHIQFNIVDTETLRDAQKNPGEYRDLLVRMAGYSDYFNDMNRDLQEEIISRTENGEI
ncbi:hypothetical protein MASR1M46_13090 [Bacteroidales bacterium]